MDRNFYDNDFEEFLRRKADQYKMYPSDRVWNNIYSSLHGRRRWVALGFTLFFMASALLVGRQVVLSNYNKLATQLNKSPEALISSDKTVAGNFHQPISANRVNTVNNKTIAYPVTTIHQVSKNHNNHTGIPLPATNTANSEMAPANTESGLLIIENNTVPAVSEKQAGSDVNTAFSVPEKKMDLNETLAGKANLLLEKNTRPAGQNENAIVKLAKPSKWFLQFYASPTISYRRLSNLDEPQNTVPVSAGYGSNINKYVHHKPAPGFEFGTNIQYKLSNSLSVYAGVQLNYSRYYIDAYKYHTEKASIALNSSSRVPDTLSGYTNIRNFEGYAPEQLQNKYWQLSVPLGIEIKLLGNKNLQFSVAGGVQPTFLINSTSYLISSDYKNYIQSPDLARSFNVHTNFEAFISYKAGGLKWQFGPQFRSQLLSSYSNKYGVREYLTEYGIKFGVTKSF